MFHRLSFPQSWAQNCYSWLRAEPGVPNFWKYHPRKPVTANMMDGLLQEGSLAILGHNLKLFLIIHWALHITEAPQTLILSRPLQDWVSAVVPAWQPGCIQGKSQGELVTPCNLDVFEAGSNFRASVSWKCTSTPPSSLSSTSPPSPCLQTTPETGRRLSNFHNFHSEMLENFLFPSWTLL